MADIIAAVLFFTAAAMLSELLIVRLTFQQSLEARIAAIPLMVATARPYGAYRDWFMMKFSAADIGRWARTAVDTAAFISFQLPVYACILWMVGATLTQILVACASTAVLMALSARLFGIFLDMIRRLFRAVPR